MSKDDEEITHEILEHALSPVACQLARETGIAFGWHATDLLLVSGAARLLSACVFCKFNVMLAVEVPEKEPRRTEARRAGERVLLEQTAREALRTECPHWIEYLTASLPIPVPRAASYADGLVEEDAVKWAIHTGIAFGVTTEPPKGQPAEPSPGHAWMVLGCEVCGFAGHNPVPTAFDRLAELASSADSLLVWARRGAAQKGCHHLMDYEIKKGTR